MSLILLGIIFPCMLPYFMSYLTKISEIITPIRYFVTGFFHLYFNKIFICWLQIRKTFSSGKPRYFTYIPSVGQLGRLEKAFQVWSNKFGLEKVKAKINKGVFVSLQVHKLMHKVISNEHAERFHADIKLWKTNIRQVLIRAWWGAAVETDDIVSL